MVRYTVVEIFTSEKAKWEGRPIDQAVVEHVRSFKLAARCLVTRGTDGCYENGEVATRRIELLSYNMPVRITIVLPSAEMDRVLPGLDAMVSDGVVAVQDLQVNAPFQKLRKNLLLYGPEGIIDCVAGKLSFSETQLAEKSLPVPRAKGQQTVDKGLPEETRHERADSPQPEQLFDEKKPGDFGMDEALDQEKNPQKQHRQQGRDQNPDERQEMGAGQCREPVPQGQRRTPHGRCRQRHAVYSGVSSPLRCATAYRC